LDDTVRRPSLVVRWLSHPQASFYLVLVPALLLLGLGVIMVQSASSVYAKQQFGDSYYFVKRQLVFLVIGIGVAWLLTKLKVQQMRALGWLLLALAFVFQILTFTPLGWGKNGNTNWVELGTSLLRFQPSELAKLALVVWAADVFERKYKLMREPKHVVFPFIFVSALLIGLVVLQADLGTGVILGAIMFAILWFTGVRWKVLTSVIAVIAVGVLTLIAVSPNRMSRIFGFLSPDSDTLGANHQPIKAMFAMATGGWWGVGLGGSRQKWGGLVEAHNDYVLAVVGEELGLVSILVILGLFLTLGYAGFRIAMRSDNNFIRFLAAGITSWFMIQALANVLVVLRLFPVIGVPLPFVSYGGSALLSTICGVALLLACARMEPEAREYIPDSADAPISKSFLAFANSPGGR
jgi:cell division protein FtsW